MILFTSTTCKPCKELKLWLAEQKIEVKELDVRKCPTIVKSLGIKMVPTLAIHEVSGDTTELFTGNEEIRPYLEQRRGS